MRSPVPAVAAALLLAACGGADPAPGVAALDPGTSADALCSEAPTPAGDGYATMRGCGFVQQTGNIERNGSALPAPADLVDAAGAHLGTVRFECGSWFMGDDGSGVTIIVNRDTGEVRSHGTVHAGELVSTLPASVPAPVDVTAP